MPFLRAYGTATGAGTHIRVPHLLAGSSDYAGSGDWTPGAGDVLVSKDGGTAANIATLPAFTNGAWQYEFSAAELQAKTLEVRIVATEVENDFFIVETYGHGSAQFESNLAKTLALDALVDGLTVEDLLTLIVAALCNVAERPTDTTVQFNKRDGTTPALTVTLGDSTGERTGSVNEL